MSSGGSGGHPVLIIGDIVSGAVVGGTLLGYLPDIAATFAIVWYTVQLYDRFRE